MHRVTCFSAAYAVDLDTSTTRTTGPSLVPHLSWFSSKHLRDGRFESLGTATRSSPACVSTAGSADPAPTTSLARATSSSSHSAAGPATGYGCFVYAIHAAIRLGHEHATTLHLSTDGQSSYADAATLGHDYATTVCVSSDSQSNYIWSHASSTSISYEP